MYARSCNDYLGSIVPLQPLPVHLVLGIITIFLMLSADIPYCHPPETGKVTVQLHSTLHTGCQLAREG